MTHPPRPIDNRPQPGSRLTRPGVTNSPRSPIVFRVPKSWPVEEFREYLLTLMDHTGIGDYAELSRLSGVSQTQLSNWRLGKSQPSTGSLRKIAAALNVAPVTLFLAAGVNDHDELEMAHRPDFRIGPPEFTALAELWDGDLTDEQRSFIRRSIATLAAGIRAERTRADVGPHRSGTSSPRRTG